VSAAPLGEIAKLMRDASFFAGNDSGPAHVAAAFGVPQVVFFGPSDSEVWAPWRTPVEVSNRMDLSVKSAWIGRFRPSKDCAREWRLRRHEGIDPAPRL